MYIDLFCRNVRGFNVYSHRSGFRKWWKKNKPLFGGIIETHVKQPKIQKFINGILPGWNFAENYSFSDIGKIWVVWHSSVVVTVPQKSLQSITSEVRLPNQSSVCIITIVHASNDDEQRMELWQELVNLSVDSKIINKPWIILGDFNQILHPEEHSRPPTLNIDTKTRLFRETLLEADLADLTYKGPKFTWTNKSKTHLVAKKLDRVFVNDDWISLNPYSIPIFGEPDFSDHAVCGVLLKHVSVREKCLFASTIFHYITSSLWIISPTCGTLRTSQDQRCSPLQRT